MGDEIDAILEEMRREHDEVVAKIDREHAAILATIDRERETWTERMDRRLDDSDVLLRFVGELNRRGEIVLQDLLRGTAAMRAEIRESIREMKASTQRIERSTREIEERTKSNTETTNAQTSALFALIDRLEGGGGGLAPAG